MAKRTFSISPRGDGSISGSSYIPHNTSVLASDESRSQLINMITELDLMGFDVNTPEGIMQGLSDGMGYEGEDLDILLQRLMEVQGISNTSTANNPDDWDWDDEDIDAATVEGGLFSGSRKNKKSTRPTTPEGYLAKVDGIGAGYDKLQQDTLKKYGRNIHSDTDLDEYSAEEQFEDEIQEIGQEFTSENTSINSGRLPAVFNMVQFNPGTVNIDYGGGRFDNVAEYLSQYDVINLVYDPYNRSKEHNQEVIRLVREHGGADTATCSNVLNVIKEEEVRLNVLNNIKKLVKPSGTVYITVYEGKGTNEGAPTKSGYQLNRKTADYLEEIQRVFPDATRKGKLIVCHPSGGVTSAETIKGDTLPGPGDYNPPEYDDPEEYDKVEEIAEFRLDAVIHIDKDGNWTYEDESYPWARQSESQDDLYSDEYPDVMLSDLGHTVELVDSLLEPKLPMEKGWYRITGDVSLVFDISGVEYSRKSYGPDDYEDDIYTDNAQATFNFNESNITDFKCKKVRK